MSQQQPQQQDLGTSPREDDQNGVSPFSNSGKPNLYVNIPPQNDTVQPVVPQEEDVNNNVSNVHQQQQHAPTAAQQVEEDDEDTTTLECGTIPNFFSALPAASNIQQQQPQQPQPQQLYQEQQQQHNIQQQVATGRTVPPSYNQSHPQIPNARSHQQQPQHQLPQQPQQRQIPQQPQPMHQRQAQSPGPQRGTIQIPIQPQPPAQRRSSASALSTPKKGASSQRAAANANNANNNTSNINNRATSTGNSNTSSSSNNYNPQQQQQSHSQQLQQPMTCASPSEKKRGKSRVTFQKARIKKIMQQDEEVGKIAAPVPILLSRCLELLIADMVKGTCNITKQKNAKTMSVAHFKECVESNEKFDFLKEKVQHIKVTQSESPTSPGADNLDEEPKTKKRRNSKSATGEPPKKRGRKKKEEPASPPAASRATMPPPNVASSSTHQPHALPQLPQAGLVPQQQAQSIPFPVHQTANNNNGSTLPLPRPSAFGTTPGGMSLPTFAPSNGPHHSLPSPPPGLRTPPKVSLPPPINTGNNNNTSGSRVVPPPPHHVHVPTPIPSFSPNKQNMFPLPSVHNIGGGLPNTVPSLQQMLNSQPPSSAGGPPQQQPDK